MAGRKYKTEDDLPPELYCEICCHIPRENVYQCKESHIVCEDCLKEFPILKGEEGPRCSQCRQILAGDGLIQNKNLEKILNPLKLDCSFNTKGCQETQMERKVLREHQDYCYYNPLNGPAVRFCQLLFHPDCDFGITSGTGKFGVDHFEIHKSIIKKSTKFQIQQNEIQNAEKDTSFPFWTPIFVEIPEHKCNVLISVVCDPTKNSLGFISFLIPFRSKNNIQESSKPSSIQLEFSISNGPAKKSRHCFTQVPIIISRAEETILQILQEPLPPPRKLQSSRGSQPSGSGKGMKITVNVKQVQARVAQKPPRLEMISSDAKIVNQNKKVPSTQPTKPQKNKNKEKKALNGLSSIPWFRSILVLLMAIGAIYWGNSIWQGDSGDLAVNKEQKVSSEGRERFHHKNKYVPKDENGDFIDMSPAEANATFWEIVDTLNPNLLAEFKQYISSADGDKRKDLGEFIAVGELNDALEYLLEKMKTDVQRKKEFISEFELLPLAEHLENNQQQSFEAESISTDDLKNYEREKFTVDQMLNVLVMKNQTLAFEKMKILFETLKITDFNPKILQNILSLSCRHNSAKIVNFFVKMGLPVNNMHKGHTPLHFAISNKNSTEALKITEVLLENGADCNIKSADEYERIPWVFAKSTKSEKFTTELARLYSKYDSSCTPLPFDKAYYESKLKETSLSNEYLNDLIVNSTARANLEGMRYLLEKALEKGLKLSEVSCGEPCSEKKLTLIHLVFILDKNTTQGFEKIKYLVENKHANVHSTEKFGSTLLHFASEFGTAQTVEYFISKGLDVNAKDKNNLTPLLAILGNENETEGIKIGTLLIENGAKCEYPNMTALDKQTRMKYNKILDYLYKTYERLCLKNNLQNIY